MELLAACQGIDLRGPKRLGKGTEPTYRKLRDRVAMLEEDRVMYPDIDAAVVLIREGL